MEDASLECALFGQTRGSLDASAAACARRLSSHALRKRRNLPDQPTELSVELRADESVNFSATEYSPQAFGSSKRRRNASSSEASTGTRELQQGATCRRDYGSLNEAQSPWHDHRSSDAGDSTDLEDHPNPEALCAEVLQLLRTGTWEDAASPPTTPTCSAYRGQIAGCKPTKRSRRAGNAGAPRRKYTWRSLHHRGKDYEQPTGASLKAAAAAAAPPVSDDTSGSSHKERDKEWAALTTWLRMNLHQPRTNKRQVLFVADVPQLGAAWRFRLNDMLSWDDVSEETKLRLKTLHEETEAAFSHKYPTRPASEWQTKTQKYKPSESDTTVQVPLGEMVMSLRDMYNYHEGTLL